MLYVERIFGVVANASPFILDVMHFDLMKFVFFAILLNLVFVIFHVCLSSNLLI